MNQVKSFENLRTWQEAQYLVKEIYNITDSFPYKERFVLVDQIRRAAISVPSNIAEGKGRASTKKYVQFLIFARGSIHEVLSQIETAKLLNYFSLEILDKISQRYYGLNAGINAHITSLKKYTK